MGRQKEVGLSFAEEVEQSIAATFEPGATPATDEEIAELRAWVREEANAEPHPCVA